MHINKLTTSKRRDELRLLHGGWMRRIQDAADVGKIGGVLKQLMGEEKAFKLEVLYGEDENEVDSVRISGAGDKILRGMVPGVGGGNETG